MAQDRINAVLQQAILSLCKVNYSDKIEIDGIICISSLNTQQQDVVKIHQTIEPQQSAPSNKTLVESALALSLGAGREKTVTPPGGVELTKTTAPGVVSETPGGGAKKTPKGRKRNRKTQDNDPDFNSKAKTDHTPDVAETNSAKKLRRSTKKSKVSYAEASPIDSEMSDYTEDYIEEQTSGNERYGLQDTASPAGQNVSFGSASVLLKLLADPRAKKMGKQGKKSMLDSVLKGAGLLSGMRQEVLPLTQSSQPVATGYQCRAPENHTGNMEAEMAAEDSITVKEEPQWDDEYESAQPSQSGESTANEKGNEQASETDKTSANNANEKDNSADGALDEESSAMVKAEPEWDETEYGSPAGPMLGTSVPRTGKSGEQATGKDGQVKEGVDANKSAADSRKSILMNILKGPPIVDSYLQKQKPGVYVDNEENSDSRESLPKTSSASEQDNSLLYRLPYASFSELLFPHSSKNILSDAEKGERQLSTIDYLANLKQTHGSIPSSQVQQSSRGRYKTRLKSGSTDPVRYKDLVGATDNLPGEEIDEALKESTEDVYIPEIDPYESEGQQIQSDQSRRKNRPKPLFAKLGKGRWPETRGKEQEVLDSDTSADQSTLGNVEGDIDSVWAGSYFRCKICTRIFADRVSRDEHEEEERQTLQAHQCPICDGFFGSEETKAIHMEERHGIQTLSPKQRAAILQKMGRNTGPWSKRKPYTTKRYQTVSEKTVDKPKPPEREEGQRSSTIASEVKDNGPEKVPENDPEAVEVKTEEEGDANTKKIECSFCEMLFEDEDSKMEHLISFHGVSSEEYGNVYS